MKIFYEVNILINLMVILNLLVQLGILIVKLKWNRLINQYIMVNIRGVNFLYFYIYRNLAQVQYRFILQS